MITNFILLQNIREMVIVTRTDFECVTLDILAMQVSEILTYNYKSTVFPVQNLIQDNAKHIKIPNKWQKKTWNTV